MNMQAPTENFENVLFEVKNRTGFMTMNRPKALNALNFSSIDAIAQQLREWEESPFVERVVISSSQERAFCAGGDLRQVYDIYLAHEKKLEKLGPLVQDYFRKEYALNAQVKHYSKPYIAIMNGITMGGGLGISIHGTIRIAMNNLVLAMPETSIGYFTDAGATYFLSRLEGELGTYVALTSARLNATEALYVGLVDQIIGEPPKENLLKLHEQLINDCFQYDSIEDILEALLKNNSPFALKTYYELIERSPVSLKLTLQILRHAKSADFDTCMEREYRLARFFIESHDFYEGIRAAVIDKDRKPQWSPEKLSDIDLSHLKVL